MSQLKIEFQDALVPLINETRRDVRGARQKPPDGAQTLAREGKT